MQSQAYIEINRVECCVQVLSCGIATAVFLFGQSKMFRMLRKVHGFHGSFVFVWLVSKKWQQTYLSTSIYFSVCNNVIIGFAENNNSFLLLRAGLKEKAAQDMARSRGNAFNAAVEAAKQSRCNEEVVDFCYIARQTIREGFWSWYVLASILCRRKVSRATGWADYT